MSDVAGKPCQTGLHVLLLAAKSHKKRLGCGHIVDTLTTISTLQRVIRKYWEPISAFFSGVVEGLKAAFAPVADIFSPLAPVFDSFMDKVRGVWQWFKGLIAQVKATQETLDSCKNAGVMFGKLLADALMLPLKSFNKLRGGVNWLLEKLGVINKESNDLDQKAAKASSGSSPCFTVQNVITPPTLAQVAILLTRPKSVITSAVTSTAAQRL